MPKKERCAEVKSLLDIEGYAQSGQVSRVSLTDCDKNRNYIIVELIDGKTVCSPCMDTDIIRVSIRIIEHYVNTVKLVASMMKGITA